ncbi:unnamed protein product [Polarella glacialis]|uniref:Uncharacterized protein n=1 Tax=Polarella glacialis TaxID=89957 RepID=A0A813IQQ8_POLGL|nr:unnamed protein product [Polarella glacialis]
MALAMAFQRHGLALHRLLWSLALLALTPATADEFQGLARQLLVHREEPKFQNKNGPCSTMVDAGGSISVMDLKEIVGSRLGFTVASFTFDGEEVLSLADLQSGSLISALEAVQGADLHEDKPISSEDGPDSHRCYAIVRASLVLWCVSQLGARMFQRSR